MLPPLADAVDLFSQDIAEQRIGLLANSPADFWYLNETIATGAETITWYISGTQPSDQDHAYAFAILIEAENTELASQIAELLEQALYIPND